MTSMNKRRVTVEFDVWSKDDEDAKQMVYEHLQIHLPQINRLIETWKINSSTSTKIQGEN